MREFLKVATGISGALAVAFGAMGAHSIKGDPEFKDIWKTGCHYHLIHSVALGISAFATTGRKQKISGILFLLGIVLFSGSCYAVALTHQKRSPYSLPAPFGGTCLILGWLALGLL